MAWSLGHATWVAAGLVAATAVWVGACAQGTGISEDDDDDDGSGAGSQGGTHVGGSTTTTGPGGSGPLGGGGQGPTAGQGGVGASGATGGQGGFGGAPCTEDPCKLTLPQCGCSPGQKCTLSGDQRTCVGEGTVDWGGECGTCKAGYLCVAYGGPPTTCHKFCDTDADCGPPGGLCVLQLSDGQGGTLPDKLCSVNCDVTTSTGCPVPGMKCGIGFDDASQQYFSLCIPAGSGYHGASCADSYDCASGYHCFDVGGTPMCLQWCNVSSPFCNTGMCTGLDPPIQVGSVQYGGCL